MVPGNGWAVGLPGYPSEEEAVPSRIGTEVPLASAGSWPYIMGTDTNGSRTSREV